MHLLKRGLLFLMAGTMSIMGGCGMPEGGAAQKSETSQNSGYVEKVLGMPEQTFLICFDEASEGKAVGYFYDTSGQLVCYSLQPDKTWQKEESLGWMKALSQEQDQLISIHTLTDGKKLAIYQMVEGNSEDSRFIMNDEDSHLKAVRIDQSGNATALPLPTKGLKLGLGVAVSDKGDYFAADSEGKINRYNEAGKLVWTYEVETDGFLVSGEKLYTIDQNNDSVSVLDIETGNENSKLSFKPSSGQSQLYCNLLGEVYLINSNGIGRIKEERIEEVVGKERTSFGTVGMNNLSVLINKSSLLLSYTTSGGEAENKYYDYEKNLPVITHKLTFYMLEDNSIMSLAASQYQNEHPDTSIEVVIGEDPANGITKEDAVSDLNKLFLAGEGPDMVLLDGLNVAAYIEQGMLEDMSSWFNEEDRKKWYDHVTKAYEKEGRLYALPTHYEVTTVWGQPDVISKLHTVDDLVSSAQEEENGALFEGQSALQILKKLYPLEAKSLFAADGTLNEEELAKLLSSTKQLLIQSGEDEQQEEEEGGLIISDAVISDVLALAYHAKNAAVVTISSLQELMAADQAMTMTKGDFKLLSEEDSSVFTPTGIIGVNKETKEQAVCKDVVSYLMSEKVQSKDSGIGFPVNQSAAEDMLSVPDENEQQMYYYIQDAKGRSMSFNMKESQLMTRYMALGSQVDQAASMDSTLIEMMAQEGEDYFKEKLNWIKQLKPSAENLNCI